jgi:hypothetical protein
MLRFIVAVDTFISSCSSNALQCSSSVRRGLLRRWLRNHSSSVAPLMSGGTGMSLGSTLPVSGRLFSQRLIEGKETPKILATSALGIPRSTASNTLTLGSFEYALMQDRFAKDQASRKPLSNLSAKRPSSSLPALPADPGSATHRGGVRGPSTTHAFPEADEHLPEQSLLRHPPRENGTQRAPSGSSVQPGSASDRCTEGC